VVPADCGAEPIPERCFAFWARSTEDFRAPLVLYYMEDLSYKEIADVLASLARA
jgi:DNA-directed RNA polymerase specialized sigma24 family protein